MKIGTKVTVNSGLFTGIVGLVMEHDEDFDCIRVLLPCCPIPLLYSKQELIPTNNDKRTSI